MENIYQFINKNTDLRVKFLSTYLNINKVGTSGISVNNLKQNTEPIINIDEKTNIKQGGSAQHTIVFLC
jgi:hypothetical protein